jgi:primosomal protein N' (replication factor Y)
MAQGLSMSDDSQAVAEVLLPLALPTTYSYVIPTEMRVEPGNYVLVPLGGRTVIGVVWATGVKAPNEVTLRPIAAVLDPPPLGVLQRKFIDWVASYYVEPPGNILRMVLRVPSALAPAKEQVGYHASGRLPARMTPQRRRALDVAQERIALRAGEIAELAGVGASVVRSLIRDGALEPLALPAFKPFLEPDLMGGQLVLSTGQERAARELRANVAQRNGSVTLLDGVTGSGKTEVYFEAMAAALARGMQVLLMLPEIALTASFLARVERRFGVEPAHWHSDVRPRERERVWRGVAEGRARIVVGARSALFLPWKSLGLIVVDEEHEGAYKQEDGVAYHARDMAVVYGALGRFPVVLSSATPSLESLVNVERGRYGHVRLESRHNQTELPPASLIDMRVAPIRAQSWLSDPLVESVKTTLAAGDQALLFLNRRGYAPLTLCRACGYRLDCPNCSASLVEHRFRKQLQCHHCGHFEAMPSACPKCGIEGKLVPCGPGIERLAEEAAQRFPDARIAVLSSDLARGSFLRDALSGVEHGQYNLIIGTQLVAKGHHFPHLTLAGVVDADLALELGDPRGGERTWQLMAQVAGRAGRGEKQGSALIQTHLPDHPLMDALRRGDRERFLAQEKRVREQARLPPYSRLAAIIVSGTQAHETERLARNLRVEAPQGEGVDVLGPAPAPLHLVRGRYRWRFLLRAGRVVNLQAYIRQWLADLKPKGSLRIDIDVDPYSFL